MNRGALVLTVSLVTGLSDTDQILAEPAQPDVLGLRTRTLGHPRRGPVLDAEGWSKLTVSSDGRARQPASGGVIRVA